MTESLRVEVTALAAQHIRQADNWWRMNRPAAPNAVRQEVQQAFALIAAQPRIGSRATNVNLPGVRRVYLPIIKQYLYYHLVGESEYVEVVALWHSRRGEGPPI